MVKVLGRKDLGALVERTRAGGFRVFGPVSEAGVAETNPGPRSAFREITSVDQMDLERVNTVRSIKDIFFPPTETILRFDVSKEGVTCEGPDDYAPPTVVIGARACDAASLDVMDPLWNQDPADEFWGRRRAATTVATIACTEADAYCMCTSLGYGPDAKAGSDVMLYPASGGAYIFEALTAKGRALEQLAGDIIAEAEVEPLPVAEVPIRFELERVGPWLAEHFEDPFWDMIYARCLGCGICTFLCPTCHCFDIQDEGAPRRGRRVRNWDSCSFALFTLHASGHNPRAERPARWRQRIEHKFRYYVDDFGTASCTGCGRCVRHCPVDMGVREFFEEVSARAGEPSADSEGSRS
jgi:sulfhydrogenase subunit beta (sulfur reductase)